MEVWELRDVDGCTRRGHEQNRLNYISPFADGIVEHLWKYTNEVKMFCSDAEALLLFREAYGGFSDYWWLSGTGVGQNNSQFSEPLEKTVINVLPLYLKHWSVMEIWSYLWSTRYYPHVDGTTQHLDLEEYVLPSTYVMS